MGKQNSKQLIPYDLNSKLPSDMASAFQESFSEISSRKFNEQYASDIFEINSPQRKQLLLLLPTIFSNPSYLEEVGGGHSVGSQQTTEKWTSGKFHFKTKDSELLRPLFTELAIKYLNSISLEENHNIANGVSVGKYLVTEHIYGDKMSELHTPKLIMNPKVFYLQQWSEALEGHFKMISLIYSKTPELLNLFEKTISEYFPNSSFHEIIKKDEIELKLKESVKNTNSRFRLNISDEAVKSVLKYYLDVLTEPYYDRALKNTIIVSKPSGSDISVAATKGYDLRVTTLTIPMREIGQILNLAPNSREAEKKFLMPKTYDQTALDYAMLYDSIRFFYLSSLQNDFPMMKTMLNNAKVLHNTTNVSQIIKFTEPLMKLDDLGEKR